MSLWRMSLLLLMALVNAIDLALWALPPESVFHRVVMFACSFALVVSMRLCIGEVAKVFDDSAQHPTASGQGPIPSAQGSEPKSVDKKVVLLKGEKGT